MFEPSPFQFGSILLLHSVLQCEMYRKGKFTSEDVNLEILKQFRENDIGFAFPSITLDVENSIHIEESK